MATPGENYNPTEAFHRELEAQENAADRLLNMTFEQKMSWSQRASSDWASAVEGRMLATLGAKNEEVTAEIRKIEATQMGELDEADKTLLKETQQATFSSIQQRVQLMVEMAGMQADNQPLGTDTKVSSHVELTKLREIQPLIERIDVQQLVFTALKEPLKTKYLESVGGKFPPDFFPIIEKAKKHEALDENELALLVNEVRNLGNKQEAIAQSSVMIVLGLLPLKDRMILLEKMAVEESFPNFEEVITGMTATTYISTAQATQALDTRKAYLEAKKKTAKRREDKVIDEEISQLDETSTAVNSDAMKETQRSAQTIRTKASKYYGSRTFGHKNYAQEFLSVKGIGSFLLTANGAMTMFANFAMDPLGFPTNSMFWLGAAEVGVGLEWGNGQGGLLGTPTEWAAKLVKGKHEEKDDLMTEYTRAMKTNLNNNPTESHFYATYAERIMTVHKAKKLKHPEETPKLTLADIGVSKKEDLPAEFRDLWEHKGKLEAKISDWAEHFTSIHAEAGQKLTEWDTQRKFIEDARAEEGLKPKKYPPLDYFEYHAQE